RAAVDDLGGARREERRDAGAEKLRAYDEHDQDHRDEHDEHAKDPPERADRDDDRVLHGRTLALVLERDHEAGVSGYAARTADHAGTKGAAGRRDGARVRVRVVDEEHDPAAAAAAAARTRRAGPRSAGAAVRGDLAA